MAEDYIPSHLKTNNAKDKVGDTLYDIKQIRGTRTSFNEKGDYKVDNLMYPTDLLSANTNEKYTRTGNTEYGNNYIVFYININESSKLLTDKYQKDHNTTVADWSANDKDRIVGQKMTAVDAGIGSGIEGAIAGGALKGDVTGAAQGGAIAAVGVGAIASQTATFTRQMKRLTAAVALHTPNQLSARYGMQWSEEDTNMFQMAKYGAEGLAKAVSEFADPNREVSQQTKDQLGGVAAAISLNTVPGKAAISAITGLAANPKKEQVFKGVDFRNFTFEYQFYPKSPQEYQNVQNIIYLFKLHMHPEYKDADNFLFMYPSEFDIVHYNGIDENFNLPRHTSCVLTEMVVNYAPQSQFTSFAGGKPTQINITLSFKELSILTKERIQEGY